MTQASNLRPWKQSENSPRELEENGVCVTLDVKFDWRVREI